VGDEPGSPGFCRLSRDDLDSKQAEANQQCRSQRVRPHKPRLSAARVSISTIGAGDEPVLPYMLLEVLRRLCDDESGDGHIGGVSAEVLWAGVVGRGLYQINTRIRASLTDGEHAVVAGVGGSSSQSTNAKVKVAASAKLPLQNSATPFGADLRKGCNRSRLHP
jgi:hypothetical protein